MSSEDDQLKGPKSHNGKEPREILDPTTREWIRVMDGWRGMQRTNAPSELSTLQTLVANTNPDFAKGKRRTKIVTTIGTPDPDAMKAVAQSDRNQVPALREAVFVPTTGPLMFAQELRINLNAVDDLETGGRSEGYDVLRVELRDDTQGIAVSYGTKPLDNPREWGQEGEFIPVSALRKDPEAVTGTMENYLLAHAPLEIRAAISSVLE